MEASVPPPALAYSKWLPFFGEDGLEGFIVLVLATFDGDVMITQESLVSIGNLPIVLQLIGL